MRKYLLILILIIVGLRAFSFDFSAPFGRRDYKSQEIKYQYDVLKDDAKYKRDNKILKLNPSGYMTVEEYEKQSEYKDKSTSDYDVPKIEADSDFKYIPKPLYRIVKYNDPPGGTELSLGKKLYSQRQINAQGIVSPDYSKLVYPAVYYYSDGGAVAADLFVIPLTGVESNLKKILSANVAKRIPEPILSTDKAIDNYAAFRTLTPVDFSSDGSKLLVKEKIGSAEDGIWQTNIYVYDFSTQTDYDLSVVRDAISYYWGEFRNLNLIEKMWDIVPLGFDLNSPDTVVVKAYAYTGTTPVYLGTWAIDSKGEQSRLVSFDKNYIPQISSNGYKVIKDGVQTYQTVQKEEKNLAKQDKIKEKQLKSSHKQDIKKIKNDYKYEIKTLRADFKDEYKDNKKLQTFAGSTEGTELEEAYKKYQQEQLQKDIIKTQKQINKQQKKIDKLDNELQKSTQQTQELFDKVYGAQSQSSNNSQDSGNSEFYDFEQSEEANEN